MVIPLFIIVHNQYEVLKRSLASFENCINTPIEIIFHDVNSFYFETLNFLKQKEIDGYKVYRSNVNNHHNVLDSIKDYLSKNKQCEYVIITDPDIELFKVNMGNSNDILNVYIDILNKTNKTSVGPMLELFDIPDEYLFKNHALELHNIQFWKKPRKKHMYKNTEYSYIECNTDTTFQLLKTSNIPKSFPYSNSIRMLAPYSARHLDWYITPNNLYPSTIFSHFTSSKISHWNAANYANAILTHNNPPKYDHIYYYNACKCRNNYNVGDYITPFIYKKLFNKNPIHSKTGGYDNKPVIFGAGSILQDCNKNSIIWGSGFMFGTENIHEPKKILSVRGPLTRDRLLKLGYDCPAIYGDIGLILPYFYYPEKKKKWKLGIIPHYVDKQIIDKLYSNKQNIKILDVTKPIDKFIDDLVQCEYTVSSSLHGIIFSHAYNIKTMWIKISDKIAGKGFKYRDYYGSLNIDYTKIQPFSLNKEVSTEKIIKLIKEYNNPDFPINTKHIIEICPFIKINKM